MAPGRSTKVISMIKWIRTSRLSIKNSLSPTYDRVRVSKPVTGIKTGYGYEDWARVSIPGMGIETGYGYQDRVRASRSGTGTLQ